MIVEKFYDFYMCCGLGGAAKGFRESVAQVGPITGKWECLGGIDIDPAAVRDFAKFAGVPGTVMDLFDRDQYTDFHGKEPPPEWKEATAADVRRAAGNRSPNAIVISSPCKGLSGLLSEALSKTKRYQALNRLTLRCVWLMMEAWADNPPEIILFENVPRIASRGRYLLDQITALLHRYGYAVAETTHDCGEIGGLAQSRKRFLMVARHMEKVPPFLYEPEKKSLLPVGAILDRMPMPGAAQGGPMHRIPRLQWKTWVRLAFVEAGSDWRSLNKLAVDNGHLRDYLIVPEYRPDYLGVNDWNESMGAVADPRTFSSREGTGHLGVNRWEESSGVVTANGRPGAGKFSVADPRGYGSETHKNVYRIVKWGEHTGTITSGHGPSSGGGCVADPRGSSFAGKYHVVQYGQHSNTVIAGSTTGQGAFAVADPRTGKQSHSAFGVAGWDSHSGTVAGESYPSNGSFAVADPRTGLNRGKGDNYLTAGHYGVIDWRSSTGAVSSAAGHDSGRWSVADPRIDSLPALDQKTIAVIRSLDGTWHRPFTTLELSALQSLIEPEEYLELDGLNDMAWRERIGNAIPPKAGKAMGNTILRTLLLAKAGETFMLTREEIWVRPLAIAISVAQGEPS